MILRKYPSPRYYKLNEVDDLPILHYKDLNKGDERAMKAAVCYGMTPGERLANSNFRT